VTVRRRRGLLLLSVALASGALAASQVHEHERRVAEQLGPSVDVLVAAHELRAGSRVGPAALALRRVPARFAPPDALSSPASVAGARTAVPLTTGSYLSAGLIAGPDRGQREDGVRRGQRAVTVEIAGGTALAGLTPGARVDVLVSTETGTEGGRTSMPLAGAQLLRLGERAGGGYPHSDAPTEASTGPTALATLRVTLRQAIYLTAADNFAREIRLLARPPGDRSRSGAVVSQGQL
jgi:pilus assembly protein CpaB